MAYFEAHTGRKEIGTATLKWTISKFKEKIVSYEAGVAIKLENIQVGETKWHLKIKKIGHRFTAGPIMKRQRLPAVHFLYRNKTVFALPISRTLSPNVAPRMAIQNFFPMKAFSVESILFVKITAYDDEKTTMKKCQGIDSFGCSEQLKFSDDFKGGWEKDDFSDLIIKGGGEVFYCHTVVLAKRSQYFRTMLESGFKESHTNEIEIENIDSCTLRAILNFIYGGRLDNMETNAVLLLEAADKYVFPKLKKICENCLIVDYMNVDNVIDVLLMADLHKASELKKAAMDMIVTNSSLIITQHGWEGNLGSCPKLLIQVFKAIAMKK